MTDRELLGLAAKAVGVAPVLCYESARNCLRIGDLTSQSCLSLGESICLDIKLVWITTRGHVFDFFGRRAQPLLRKVEGSPHSFAQT